MTGLSAMAPMPSLKIMLNTEQQNLALKLARESVSNGLKTGKPFSPDLAQYPQQLQIVKASFVTLKIHHNLRGCIGSLVATRPLALDISENAYAAAFRDPRFPALNEKELSQVTFHVSVLSELEPVSVKDEAELLSLLKPGVDGLVLSDHGHRATFLPSVWESLPQAKDFLYELKKKAGFDQEYWSESIKFERYFVQEFGDSKN